MAERSTNTLVEWRQRVMKDIAQLKLDASITPDELTELLEFETLLMERARAPIASMQQQGMLPGGQPAQPMGGLGQGFPVAEMARVLDQPTANFQ